MFIKIVNVWLCYVVLKSKLVNSIPFNNIDAPDTNIPANQQNSDFVYQKSDFSLEKEAELAILTSGLKSALPFKRRHNLQILQSIHNRKNNAISPENIKLPKEIQNQRFNTNIKEVSQGENVAQEEFDALEKIEKHKFGQYQQENDIKIESLIPKPESLTNKIENRIVEKKQNLKGRRNYELDINSYNLLQNNTNERKRTYIGDKQNSPENSNQGKLDSSKRSFKEEKNNPLKKLAEVVLEPVHEMETHLLEHIVIKSIEIIKFIRQWLLNNSALKATIFNDDPAGAFKEGMRKNYDKHKIDIKKEISFGEYSNSAKQNSRQITQPGNRFTKKRYC